MKRAKEIRIVPPSHNTHPWTVEVWEDQINRPGPLMVACQMFRERTEADRYARASNADGCHAEVRESKVGDKEFA